MTIAGVPRNDIDAARRFYESRRRRISAADMALLLQLQDDSTELRRIAKHWNVVSAGAEYDDVDEHAIGVTPKA